MSCLFGRVRSEEQGVRFWQGQSPLSSFEEDRLVYRGRGPVVDKDMFVWWGQMTMLLFVEEKPVYKGQDFCRGHACLSRTSLCDEARLMTPNATSHVGCKRIFLYMWFLWLTIRDHMENVQSPYEDILIMSFMYKNNVYPYKHFHGY